MKPGGVAIGCTDSALYRGPGIQGPNRLGRNFLRLWKYKLWRHIVITVVVLLQNLECIQVQRFEGQNLSFFQGPLQTQSPLQTGIRPPRTHSRHAFSASQFDRSPCSCDVFLCYVHFGIRLFLASVLPGPTNEAVHRPPPPKEPSYATDGTDCLLM